VENLSHTAFIIAAYAFTGIVVAGLVLAIMWDHARLRRALAAMDAATPDEDA
jgi:heme exporter protein CcmD